MSICGEITQNLEFDCDFPLQAGAEDRLILINRQDWEDAVIDVNITNTQIIENIVLAGAKTGFVYEGKNNSNAPKFELIKKEFSEVYNHEINFKIFSVNADAKKELEALAKGTVVAIVQNKFKGVDGESSFEVYGSGSGLVLTQNIREIQGDATQGAFDAILKSDEKSLEPHMPNTLFNTDFATTKAIVDSLLV